jgi:phosphoglucosamine mutase
VGRLFGTDGVRGVANRDLTPELAFSLGRAAVVALGAGARPRIVIGRDTRVSGSMLQAALSAGICSAGGDAVRLGVVPTPAVAFVTRDLGAAAGVVISASHNPPADNGIKFFAGDGRKLPDEVEDRIESLLGEGAPRPEGAEVGGVVDAPEETDRYLEHLLGSAEGSLAGMRVILDCANGAAYALAPEVFHRLGAEVEAIHTEADGERINVACGATHPEIVAEAVRARGADAGVAFDGDADRALFADARGNVVDGDQVIAALAVDMHAEGRLARDTVVVTVMANLGFRRAVEPAGITVLETQVGDRYVIEEMLRSGSVLGGEQSGHVVFLDRATTGDGLLTAIRFLSLAARRGASIEELAAVMRRYPQVLENVPVADTARAAAAGPVTDAVRRAEASLGEGGRILVRASGTEPVVRVMVEAEREEDAERVASEVADAVRAAAG